MFNFLRNRQTVFLSGYTIFTFPPQCKGYNFFTSSSTLVILLVKKNSGSHSNGHEVASHCVLIFISLMAINTEHLFMCLLATCISSLETWFIQVLWPFSTLLLFFVGYHFKESPLHLVMLLLTHRSVRLPTGPALLALGVTVPRHVRVGF